MELAVARDLFTVRRKDAALVAPTSVRSSCDQTAQQVDAIINRRAGEKSLSVTRGTVGDRGDVHTEAGRKHFWQEHERAARRRCPFKQRADFVVIGWFVFPDDVELTADNVH